MATRIEPCPLGKACMFGLLLTGMVCAEPVYRWTDADGQTHYGNRPPSGVSASAIPVPAAGSTASPRSDATDSRERQRRVLDAYRYEREQKKANRARAAQAKNQRAERCRRLQRRWQRLSHRGPIFFVGADGERSYLSDEQRVARKSALRKHLVSACGKAP